MNWQFGIWGRAASCLPLERRPLWSLSAVPKTHERRTGMAYQLAGMRRRGQMPVRSKALRGRDVAEWPQWSVRACPDWGRRQRKPRCTRDLKPRLHESASGRLLGQRPAAAIWQRDDNRHPEQPDGRPKKTPRPERGEGGRGEETRTLCAGADCPGAKNRHDDCPDQRERATRRGGQKNDVSGYIIQRLPFRSD